jgi:hypothetical protein
MTGNTPFVLETPLIDRDYQIMEICLAEANG